MPYWQRFSATDKLIIPRGNAQIMSGDKVLVIAKDRVLHELSTALKLTR